MEILLLWDSITIMDVRKYVTIKKISEHLANVCLAIDEVIII